MSSRFLLADDEPLGFVLDQLEDRSDRFFILAGHGGDPRALAAAPAGGERQLCFGHEPETSHEDDDEEDLVHLSHLGVIVGSTGCCAEE